MKSNTKNIPIDQISQKLNRFFSNSETVARETKFVQRKSPLTDLIFLKAMVFGFLKDPMASLNQLAQECAKLGAPISSQALHSRFNEYSVAFIKEMYLQAFEQFKNQIRLSLPILNQFTHIFLLDSTFKALPETMQEKYAGPGGKASSASLKVQLVFEFLSASLAQLTIEAGRAADQAYIQYLDLVQAGGLVIMDLGYFRLASLRTIAEKGAYFILRYHYPTALFYPNGEKLELLDWLPSQGQTCQDQPILLGASPNQKITCRLISTPVPLAVAEERRRKAKRKAKQHQKTLTHEYLNSLSWSIFLTNVPVSMLNTSQVITFYRIRWQIELIFKFWKSHCGLDHILAVRETRVMTEFYAKLLIGILSTFLFAPVRIPDEAHPNREISLYQVRKILSDYAEKISEKLFDPSALHEILDQLYQRILRYGYKQIRRKEPNIHASLSLCSSPSETA